MFPKVKEYIQTNKKGLLGYEFFEYLDELQNSKVFKHSNINIIDNPTPQINGSTKFASNLKIDDKLSLNPNSMGSNHSRFLANCPGIIYVSPHQES